MLIEKLILKTIKRINRTRLSHVPYLKRKCITENQYSRLKQSKYFIQDYILKTKYKEIIYEGEFQQELTFALPFAYWHHLNGTLQQTTSSKNTKELYFFSNNHVESFEKREYKSDNLSYEIPNMSHNHSYSKQKWARVPLKKIYKNDVYQWNKPTLLIANKFNTEWGKPPINYFTKSLLSKIFSTYQNHFQIVYNRPLVHHIVQDNSTTLEMEETAWIRNNYPEVILMEDLYENKAANVNNYNHLQLLVYANCTHFVSVHGGTAALASYFGGTNIILSKCGMEHYFNEYNTIFPALSGANILHANSDNDVLHYLKTFKTKSINFLEKEEETNLLVQL